MEQQRRTPRFAFSASAEVIRGDSVELTSVTGLSLYGCYLASSAQFLRGTRVTVKIFAGGEFFEAPATVLYSGRTLGMGLGFREVKPVFQDVLRKWLRQALDASNAAVLPTHDGESETNS
jgi:hypothetical protein